MGPARHPPFEELEHTADLCLRVWADSLPALYDHAARGMFWLMRCRPETDAAPQTLDLTLSSFDAESLLVDWLNELLYLSETRHICYNGCEMLRCDATGLGARVLARAPARCERGIKAATYSALAIQREPAGLYVTTITFDV